MFRSLIFIVAIGIVIWLVSRMIKNKSQQISSKTRQAKSNEIKNIVQCQVCQAFVPEDKAITENNNTFCSQQHLEQWKEQQ